MAHRHSVTTSEQNESISEFRTIHSNVSTLTPPCGRAQKIRILNATVKCTESGFPLDKTGILIFMKHHSDEEGRLAKTINGNLLVNTKSHNPCWNSYIMYHLYVLLFTKNL
jgi:hypothetical protein